MSQIAPDKPDVKAAICILRSHKATYLTSSRLTKSDPRYSDPQDSLETAVADAERAAGAETLMARAALWSALIKRKDASAFEWALAAFNALRNDDFKAAESMATHALARDSRDLGAQAILHQARRAGKPDPGFEGRFCDAPFRSIETAPGGDVYFCCPSWLPKPIGNLDDQSAEDIWNSTTAQDIRASIHDGSYRYCSRSHCPKLTADTLPETTDLSAPPIAGFARTKAKVLDKMPERLVLSHDKSCNLSCPSCRSGVILARKNEQKRLNGLADRVLFPLMRQARKVRLTGSGDPFGSAHFQYVLRRLRDLENPLLRIDLQTNGVLLTSSLWDRLNIEGLVDQILVSADAATPETYSVLRRGATFDQLKRGLGFASDLRRQNRIRNLRLDFVIQTQNFREMPAFVDLANRFDCDGVKFQMIRNWGTFTPEAFDAANVARSDHPENEDFRAVLEDPLLATPNVEIWGLGR